MSEIGEPGTAVDRDGLAEAAHLSIVESSRGRGWTGIQAEELWHQADDFGLPAIPEHLLVFHLGRPLRIEERIGGRAGRLGEGSLTILPAGAETQWHLQRDAVRHLHLYLDAPFLEGVAAEAGLNPDRVEIVPSIGIRDPRFEQIGSGFLAELRSGGLGGRVYAESLAALLAVQILRYHSSAPPARERHSRLSAAGLERATDYVEDHLGDDLSLAAVAGAAGLSPYHFARLFRESTGLSPHQYIIRRRVERAKRLLSDPAERSIAAIAAEVGFTSSSHLATHFRRLVGATPREFREDRTDLTNRRTILGDTAAEATRNCR